MTDLFDQYRQLLPLLLPVGWLLLSYLAAYISGWRAMNARFPDQPGSGRTVWWQSVQFPLLAYNGGINITITEHGVRFSTAAFFRFGAPPFFVPWAEMTATESQSFWGKQVRIDTKQPGSFVVSGAGGSAIIAGMRHFVPPPV